MEAVPTVFIVDGDEAVRSALSLLVRSRGWNPRACATGGEFFAALSSAWPACIIINLQLPDMDALTLQREIGRLRMNLPVIVTTAYENHPGLLRAMLHGARAVVAKPFKNNELLAAVGRAVQSSIQPSPAPPVSGPPCT